RARVVVAAGKGVVRVHAPHCRIAGVRRADVVVIAPGGNVGVDASDRRIARVRRARVAVVAVRGRAPDARAVLALVRGRAGVAVVAGERVEPRDRAHPRAVAPVRVHRADVPVVTGRAGGIELARGRATVPVERVAVVALLSHVEDAVATDGRYLPDQGR